MKKLFLFLVVTILLSSCADTIVVQECLTVEPVGFWYGIWHGWISSVSFIIGLFDSSIAIYAIYNNGAWYDFGFIIGLGSAGTFIADLVHTTLIFIAALFGIVITKKENT